MNPADWIGRPIADVDGEPYGTLDELFVGKTTGEPEFVLYAEEPVVQKRVVPVERVKVARDTIVEHDRITDQVRKERVDVDTIPTPRETTNR